MSHDKDNWKRLLREDLEKTGEDLDVQREILNRKIAENTILEMKTINEKVQQNKNKKFFYKKHFKYGKKKQKRSYKMEILLAIVKAHLSLAEANKMIISLLKE